MCAFMPSHGPPFPLVVDVPGVNFVCLIIFGSKFDRLTKCVYIKGIITDYNCVTVDSFPFIVF